LKGPNQRCGDQERGPTDLSERRANCETRRTSRPAAGCNKPADSLRSKPPKWCKTTRVERDGLGGTSTPKPSLEMVGVDAASWSGSNRTWKAATPSFGWRTSRQVTTREARTVEGQKEWTKTRAGKPSGGSGRNREDVACCGVKIMQGGERPRVSRTYAGGTSKGGIGDDASSRRCTGKANDPYQRTAGPGPCGIFANQPASWKIRQHSAQCAHTIPSRSSSLSSTG
jgi:hypothetical protein